MKNTYAIDFDETLNLENKYFKPREELIYFLNNPEPKTFYIVTARNGTESNIRYINEFCDKYDLNPENIYFTNQELKGSLLKELNVKYFIDDNEEQLSSAIEHDITSFHPDDLEHYIKQYNLNKNSSNRKAALLRLNKFAKEEVVEVIKNYRVLMKKDLSLSNIFLDNPIGSSKKFGAKKSKKLPFDYGEFSNYINPADDMGWDIIIVPSESGGEINQQEHEYKIIGVVKVNPDEKEWEAKGGKMKKPPIGNDKLIVSTKSKISKEDKDIIENFFNSLWQFKKPIYFI